MHANYASNYRKRDNVKIIRIALDLHDVIVDSKKKRLKEAIHIQREQPSLNQQ